jgi:signal transduction histidine kinase
MKDLTQHKLQERIKELTALHKTARLLQDVTRPEREIARDILALLPPAWQYPDVTAACIRFDDLVETTPGFRPTVWMQSARFGTRTQRDGEIHVVYLEERPPEAEGPFLAEERDLIESLADMLGSYFQHKLADREVEQAYGRLEQLIETRTEELRQTNRQLEREIEQHRAARLQIEEYQQRLRQLATELSLAEERDRREIAADLHDHIIQEFAFIKLRIEQFRGDAVFCGFERNLDEIVRLLEGTIRHARQLTFEISPPILYELGLPAALEWLAEHYEKRHKLNIKVSAAHLEMKLPEAVRITLFKCVEELLTNAAKYAAATLINVSLQTQGSRLVLEVADNGCGFNVKKAETSSGTYQGFGLFSIRERLKSFGGTMTLESAIGSGTTVRLSVPWEM